ncbi:MAG TPA: SAM-dependent methyltransferase, partial [Fibrobacteres bacterium]|nr:SAM-dependent methyltransferase [Fibrobacterota bacterium]
CQGTPLRGEIEARGGQLSEATKVVAEALGKKYGAGTVNAQIQAVVVTVQR